MSGVIEEKKLPMNPTASPPQQQPIDTRGIITSGQTVLFRLPKGDIKSAVVKQNSYELLRVDFPMSS